MTEEPKTGGDGGSNPNQTYPDGRPTSKPADGDGTHFEPNFKPGSQFDHTRPRRRKPVELDIDELKPFINQYNDVGLQFLDDVGIGLIYDFTKGVMDKVPTIPSFLTPRVPGLTKPTGNEPDDGYDRWEMYPQYDRRGQPYRPGGPDPQSVPQMPFHPGWVGNSPYTTPLRDEDRGTKPKDGDRKPGGPPSGSR